MNSELLERQLSEYGRQLDAQIVTLESADLPQLAPKPPARRGWLVAVGAAVVTVVVLGAVAWLVPLGGVTPPAEEQTEVTTLPRQGPVTIVTNVRTAWGSGSFVVTEGADVLGCSKGTIRQWGTPHSVMTCEPWSYYPSFTVDGIIKESTGPYPAIENGTWSVVEATGDFVGLQGNGEWSVVFTTGPGWDHSEGTLTGHIYWAP